MENLKKLTYSVEEAARVLGVSKSLLYREIQNNSLEIPYHRIGNRIIFSVTVIEEYLNK